MSDEYQEANFQPEPLWSVERLAAYLDLGPRTIRRMVAENKIKGIKIGRTIRIPLSEVKRITEQAKSKLTK